MWMAKYAETLVNTYGTIGIEDEPPAPSSTCTPGLWMVLVHEGFVLKNYCSSTRSKLCSILT